MPIRKAIGLGLIVVACSPEQAAPESPNLEVSTLAAASSVLEAPTTTVIATAAATADLPTSTATSTAPTTPRDVISEVLATDPGIWTLNQQAMQRLISDCMDSRGFAVTLPSIAAPADVESEMTRMQQPPTLSELEQYGYDYARHRLDDDPIEDPYVGLDHNGRSALDECSLAAIDATGNGDWINTRSQLESSLIAVSNDSRADERYLAAENDWLDCMATLGYSIDSRDNVTRVAVQMPDGITGEAAIALAIADYSCADEVAIRRVFLEIVNEFATVWLDENPGAVLNFQEATDEMRTKSEAALQS